MPDDATRNERPGTLAVARAQECSPGDRIAEWIVERKLGGGGFGDVYQATHHATHARVALKLLHARFVMSPDILARFQREIDVLDRLRHPNVVTILASGFADGRPYLCLELLDGSDLASYLTEQGALTSARALPLFDQLCDALAHAHDVGIVHRDLKASNVFVAPDRAVLLDFGIAKISDAVGPDLTASHQRLGTPGTMAPEQVHGGAVDARTDIYALGCLLFYMLAGRPPFADRSHTMVQYMHLHARRPQLSAIIPISPRIDDVISKAIAIEPSERFDDVRTFQAAVRAALRESPPQRTKETEHVAILISVADRTGTRSIDESLVTDLEAVLPLAERFLADRGFAPALDLGSRMVFASALHAVADAIATAHEVWRYLEQRASRDPRIRIGVAVHRGPAVTIGSSFEPCALLRPATWGIPDQLEGVWLSGAVAR